MIVRFSTQKRLVFFYGAKLIFRSFAIFFGKTIFWSGAKQRCCFIGCRSVCDQTARIWAPGFLSWWQLTSHALNYNPLYTCMYGDIGEKSSTRFSRYYNPILIMGAHYANHKYTYVFLKATTCTNKKNHKENKNNYFCFLCDS